MSIFSLQIISNDYQFIKIKNNNHYQFNNIKVVIIIIYSIYKLCNLKVKSAKIALKILYNLTSNNNLFRLVY